MSYETQPLSQRAFYWHDRCTHRIHHTVYQFCYNVTVPQMHSNTPNRSSLYFSFAFFLFYTHSLFPCAPQRTSVLGWFPFIDGIITSRERERKLRLIFSQLKLIALELTFDFCITSNTAHKNPCIHLVQQQSCNACWNLIQKKMPIQVHFKCFFTRQDKWYDGFGCSMKFMPWITIHFKRGKNQFVATFSFFFSSNIPNEWS